MEKKENTCFQTDNIKVFQYDSTAFINVAKASKFTVTFTATQAQDRLPGWLTFGALSTLTAVKLKIKLAACSNDASTTDRKEQKL